MNKAHQALARQSKGFALMMAIFLVVTLAAIGLYVLTISTGQIEAASQDQQAAQAYQAARTGIEVGAYQVLRNTTCVPSQTLSLNGYFAEITCTSPAPETEGVASISVFTVTAIGCNRSPCGAANIGPTYVERELSLILAR